MFSQFIIPLLSANLSASASVNNAFIHNAYSEAREPSLFQQRLDWEAFLGTKVDRRDFKRHLRMSKESFDKLLSHLRPKLEVEEFFANKRGGKIVPELRLYCTIRYLAGGSYSDIYLYTGISKVSFYRVVWQTISAINKCEFLKIKLPTTPEELAIAAAGFKSISFQGCINNCVYVVDGYHLQIVTPSKTEAKNVRSYFSGHYKTYGVNVQAACDHHSRFFFFHVAAPGVTGDRDAVNECGLYDLMEKLPGFYAGIDDCAYKATENMVPIYQGNDWTFPKYDAYNFYASQLRIRIEMAFGLMVKKWRIMGKPLGCRLHHVKYIATDVAQLHNYCITERLLEKGYNIIDARAVELTMYERAQREEAAACEAVSNEFPRISHNRERIADNIARMSLHRPASIKII